MVEWTKMYLRAQKYYMEHGDLEVPSRYIDDDGFAVGRWLNLQRSKYKGTDSHGGRLSEEEINKLELIGIVWDKREKSWNEYYQSSCNYYNAYGDLLIPASYIDEKGLKLGQWISKQRQYYYGKSKRGTISKERIEKLEQIGMIWDPNKDQWEKHYDLAKHYYDKNNNLSIPSNYVTDEGIRLGAWIRTQRSKYHHKGDGELSSEQIKRLENIGMIWNTNEAEWRFYYLLAKEYYMTYGDLLVPLRYTTESGEKLGAWIGRQRRKKEGKRGQLSPEQVSLLDSIGMEWNPHELYFEECFTEAKNYYTNVGDLEIESTYISANGIKLGIWISNLRQAYKQKTLSDEKIKRLESIGMLWEINNSPSQSSYPEQVVLFYLKREFEDVISRYTDLGFEIDIFIPSIMVGVEYDGAVWHKNKQLLDNEKNTLCKEKKIELFRLREDKCPPLNGISIDINVGKYTIQNVLDACNKLFELFQQKGYLKVIPPINYSEDIVEIRKSYCKAKNEAWDLMYSEAEQYNKENGDLFVPVNYVTKNGYQLGKWISNQRSNYLGNSAAGIDVTRVELLNRIGMIWNVPEYQWQHGYNEAKKFYNEYGHLKVNVKYINSSGFRLGIWISLQRKKNSLSKEQIESLDAIGMIWNVFDENWEKGIDEANEYFIKHGNLKVPSGFITDNGFRLGNWIHTQRSRYAKKKGEKPLSTEQTERLERIGMVWEVIDDSWQQGYTHAREYYEETGDLLVPNKYVCSDGYKLGNWIQTRRGGYNGIGSWSKPTDEQIKLLEQIGMVWNVEEYMWMKNYSLAKEFYTKNGNLAIPKRYETKDGIKLGIWIQRQRRMNAGKTSKKLSSDRINMLNDIGMIW